jgi:N-acetylglutamate synthase-like GNAT family acetyltransferase
MHAVMHSTRLEISILNIYKCTQSFDGWLCSLFVEEDSRGSGVGSDIVKQLVSKLQKERGAAALHNLYLLTLNGAAVLRFYKRLGFSEAAWSDVPATLKAECLIASACELQ